MTTRASTPPPAATRPAGTPLADQPPRGVHDRCRGEGDRRGDSWCRRICSTDEPRLDAEPGDGETDERKHRELTLSSEPLHGVHPEEHAEQPTESGVEGEAVAVEEDAGVVAAKIDRAGRLGTQRDEAPQEPDMDAAPDRPAELAQW